MTKLREKDDFDITLIEERYIVLENMLELEKNDLIAQNRELINQVRILNDGDNINGDKNNIEVNNNLKMEIQNLKDENKLLQNKLKDKENQIFQYQKQHIISPPFFRLLVVGHASLRDDQKGRTCSHTTHHFITS